MNKKKPDESGLVDYDYKELDLDAKCKQCGRKNRDHKYRVTLFELRAPKLVVIRDVCVDHWDHVGGFFYLTDDKMQTLVNDNHVFEALVSELNGDDQ